MFINDVHKKEEIRNIALQDLKKYGIKFRCKKPRSHVQDGKCKKVFKTPLYSLPTQTVTLSSGQQLVVPKIVHSLCSYLVTKIGTEGVFRKGGSKSRQNEIRLSLDAGCQLGDEHHEIDIASVLKTFFRELPEPLIPFSFHELFLRCMLLTEHQTKSVLLSCLLLPTEHLNTLAYFMQFLFRVSEYADFNKMDSYNLAVVIGPSLLPAEEKLHNPTQRLTKTCELFKLLIENAVNIGVLSENILERIATTCSNSSLNNEDDAQSIKKKKKRRSGSLTRMLNGLKKMVTNKSDEVATTLTPDLLSTPYITRSAKKRKLETAGISNKKRREIVNKLPQNAILNTPFEPARTPISNHPNATTKQSTTGVVQKPVNAKEKRMLWSNRSKSNKKAVSEDAVSTTSTSSIQRRWSAVSSVAGFRRKKNRNSCVGLTTEPEKVPEKDPQIDNRINDLSEELIKQKEEQVEEEYVRIPKCEYEEIKNRVTAIERRISIELDEIQTAPNGVKQVEEAYEQTLVQTEPLSPTTDQLAKRLSRELKIRRSSEQPVFRSPSARKIGSLRRKSQENATRVTRNNSWCASSPSPRGSARKSKNRVVAKSSSVNAADFKNENLVRSPKNISTVSNGSSVASWKSARGFFDTPATDGSLENCRASIARLRSQNAGMVMAKAKLFDNLGDSEGSSQTSEVSVPRVRTKMGANRPLENRLSYRVRTLRLEERRKKNMSPRTRNLKSPNGRTSSRLAMRNDEVTDKSLSILKNSNRTDSTASPKTTPRNVPHIKKPMNIKTPRRIQRTPIGSELKQTPLKVVNPRHF